MVPGTNTQPWLLTPAFGSCRLSEVPKMAQAPKSPPATWKTRMGFLTLRFRPDPALNHCKRLGVTP